MLRWPWSGTNRLPTVTGSEVLFDFCSILGSARFTEQRYPGLGCDVMQTHMTDRSTKTLAGQLPLVGQCHS